MSSARFTQRADRRHGVAGLKPLHEVNDLGINDLLGLERRLAPGTLVFLDHTLQVIDRVQVYILKSRHGRVHVARHGNVEDEHRADGGVVAARLPPRPGPGSASGWRWSR